MLPCYIFQYLGTTVFVVLHHCRSGALFFDNPWPFVAIRSITEALFFRFGAQTIYFLIRECFGGTHLGAPCGAVSIQKAFPCSAALVFHFREAFPCSVGIVLGFFMFAGVPQHGLSEGVRNIYKPNVILHMLNADRERLAHHLRTQKTNDQNKLEKSIL